MNYEQEMLDKLNMLVKITAAKAVEEKEFKEQVRFLSAMGLAPKEIGEILSKSANNVSVMLNYIKKTDR
jgi:phospholipid N-methyltransferase